MGVRLQIVRCDTRYEARISAQHALESQGLQALVAVLSCVRWQGSASELEGCGFAVHRSVCEGHARHQIQQLH
ncbi:hypothetical protein HYQ46_002863 [Verticillium longisporum]|nr:hypothetical protein HYQ46_002863 [Verticillium longisporum]